MGKVLAAGRSRTGSPPVYVLAQISIHDRWRYGRYVSRFFEVLEVYQGSLLAADEEPVLIEGSWQWDKVVLVSFPDREHFNMWVSSADYQQISIDRAASTEGTVLLVRGLVAMPGS